MGEAAAGVEAVFREERGRLLAALVRRFGDLDLAEEVTSEAIEAALVHWPATGVPPVPGAWLMTTARRKAVDRLRRDRVLATRLAVLRVEADRAGPVPPSEPDADLPDERLQLFFTCAHPALAAEDRIALTLRCLGGLTTPEVARAFLVPVETMAKRITRAKKKIREARIPFRVPGADELPDRLPVVLQAIYSIFTEGYAAQRSELADEAIRLTRILQRLLAVPPLRTDLGDGRAVGSRLPRQPPPRTDLGDGRAISRRLPRQPQAEVTGLLALMLLVHARREARTELVLLEEQDRGRWDQRMIAEGRELVVTALTGGAGPYGVQAAIAALHDEAPDFASTDWPQIVALYDVLMGIAPSPVVALNRAAAVAMRDGPRAGLELLDELAEEPLLRAHHPYLMARADLLERLGRRREAADAYRAALALAGTEPERALLRRRLAAVDG
jgi:RNA polymerase sigma-70 factor (ECF subfamily)